jgi:hypothetical protein
VSLYSKYSKNEQKRQAQVIMRRTAKQRRDVTYQSSKSFSSPVADSGSGFPSAGLYNPIDLLQFNILYTNASPVEGDVWWDPNDKTLNVKTNTDTTIQVGQETVIRGTNKTGSPLTNGQVVYVDGAQGSRPTFALADADTLATSQVIAVITETSIADNGTGFATVNGLLRDFDTSSWSAGDELWLTGTPGVMDNAQPALPAHGVSIGYVLFSNASSGIIYVHIGHKPSIMDSIDVDQSSVSDNDILRYDSASFTWVAGVSYWQRTGTVLTPATPGDTVEIDVSAGTAITLTVTGLAAGLIATSVTGNAIRGTSSGVGFGLSCDELQVDDEAEFGEVASGGTPSPGSVNIYAKTDGNMYQKDDAGLETRLNHTQVSAPIVLSYTVDKPERFSDINIHGFFEVITAAGLTSIAPINDTNGLSKLFFNVIASIDAVGTFTITGTSVDRDTGVETPADSEVITINGNTTDTSSADSGGNSVWGFSNAYISTKWWTGAFTISTTNLNIIVMEIRNIAFEQFNDMPNITLETYDITAESLNNAAELYTHLYTVVPGAGSTCVITSIADIELGTTVAGMAYRLRRADDGTLPVSLDGTTEGIFAEMFLDRASQPDWANINAKIWASCVRDLE